MFMSIVGIILGIFVLVPMLLVVLPVFLYAHYERREAASLGHVSVHPFAGLLGLRFSAGVLESRTELIVFGRRIHTLRPSKKRPEKVEEEKEKPKLKETKRRAKSLSERIALFKRLFSISIHPVFSFLKSLSKALKFRFLQYDMVFGLNDPASTGKLFGLSQAFLGSLGADRIRGELTPDFQRETLEGKFDVGVTIKLYRILAAIMALMVPILWRLGIDYISRLHQAKTAATEAPNGQ